MSHIWYMLRMQHAIGRHLRVAVDAFLGDHVTKEIWKRWKIETKDKTLQTERAARYKTIKLLSVYGASIKCKN